MTVSSVLVEKFTRIFNESFKFCCDIKGDKCDRYEFAAEVFDFTTYDPEMDKKLVLIALEVCQAVSDKKTFDFIKDNDSYFNYILVLNLPFFHSKVDWGSSIRGAWWATDGIELDTSCWGFEDEKPLDQMRLTQSEFVAFLAALKAFVSHENKITEDRPEA